jgi:hypothetical protein
MNLYSALRFEIPTIAYSALHQVRKGITTEAYMQTMKDFHRLLKDETENIRRAWEAFRQEASVRTTQSVRSLLTQYLSTPLKSDTDDIERILKEKLKDYTLSVSAQVRAGILFATEGRVIEPPGLPSLKGLGLSGRKYLTELGFDSGKTRRDIFESMFVVEGGENLDVIEHMVRDRIGIYTPVHGKHIGEFDSYAYNAHNVVTLFGDLDGGGRFEAALWFSKGGVKYDLFRSTLSESLEKIQGEGKYSSISVWQRKLGLGSGREFVLRLRGDDLPDLCHSLRRLQTDQPQKFLHSALQGGHVLCKEMVVS